MTRQPVLLLALAIAPHSAMAAQSSPASTPSGLAGELAVVAANVLAGGLTAGLGQMFSDGAFKDGFIRGAAGGAVVYLGKRTATARVDGAGWVGREIAAVGHSIVRNGSSVGSGEIGIAAGEDLVLTTSVERSLATPKPVLVSWRLDAREGAHRLVTLNGGGFPPSTMTIPAEWLGSFSQPLNVELFTQQVLRGGDADSEYRFIVTVWTYLHWTVTRSQTAP